MMVRYRVYGKKGDSITLTLFPLFDSEGGTLEDAALEAYARGRAKDGDLVVVLSTGSENDGLGVFRIRAPEVEAERIS